MDAYGIRWTCASACITALTNILCCCSFIFVFSTSFILTPFHHLFMNICVYLCVCVSLNSAKTYIHLGRTRFTCSLPPTRERSVSSWFHIHISIYCNIINNIYSRDKHLYIYIYIYNSGVYFDQRCARVLMHLILYVCICT